MRIVHLTQSTTDEVTGGLEYHVSYLSAALRRLGHEVFIVRTANTPGSTQKSPIVEPAGFRFLPASLRHRLDVAAETLFMLGRRLCKARHGSRVAEQVDRLRPDLVHQHSYLGEWRACRLLSSRYPIVFTNHTGAYLHLERWAPTRLLQRRLMKRFTMAIGPSRELTPRTDNSRYVPNGVDTRIFFPLPKQECQRIKARHRLMDKRVILCPRRWAPTKGILYLAKALHHLPQTVRERSVFVFAGNETPGYGRYQRHVRNALAVSGCEVRILGNLAPAELAEMMNVADACIFPSLMEATSLACLETMACATPVIGTDTGGLPELIREGGNGWLVPARDPGALAAGIEKVCLAASDRLERIGQHAWETVRNRYTWEATARQTEIVYREAMEKWERNDAGK